MQILPVLDLLNGVVVRGIAGQRSDYRPLVSQLTESVQALDVARALRDSFHFRKFYVADLDAILREQPNWQLYGQLVADGFDLLIDAGIRNVDQALAIRQARGIPIVGLESCPDPQLLADIVAATQNEVIFSLDLQHGKPLMSANSHGWETIPPEIVRQAVEAGISNLIVLDLADVGMAGGNRTQELCRQILARFPTLRLIGGGGVRTLEDVRSLGHAGVGGVLVASALHDGRLAPADVQTLQSP